MAKSVVNTKTSRKAKNEIQIVDTPKNESPISDNKGNEKNMVSRVQVKEIIRGRALGAVKFRDSGYAVYRFNELERPGDYFSVLDKSKLPSVRVAAYNFNKKSGHKVSVSQTPAKIIVRLVA